MSRVGFRLGRGGRVDTFERGDIRCPIGEIIYESPKGYRVGFEICEDMWQGASPQRPVARYSLAETALILSAHASHYTFTKRDQLRRHVLWTAARYKQCYVFANLLGNESGSLVFDGSLFIAQNNRAGGASLLAERRGLGYEEVGFLFSEVTLGVASEKASYRFSTDKNEPYQSLCEAACLGLWDYLRKSGQQGFVLSASGGADSSMCAVLVFEMLRQAIRYLGEAQVCRELSFLRASKTAISRGKKEDETFYARKYMSSLLMMVYQKGPYSSSEGFVSARALAQDIGACFAHWSIDDMVNAYTSKSQEALGRSFSWEKDDLVLQNIQARVRVPGVWMLAGARRAVLLVAGNASEAAMGYFTMDGDTAGGLSPLGSLSKAFILRWLRWASVALERRVLEQALAMTPSAELKQTPQKDEEELMPYAILEHMVEMIHVRRYSKERLLRVLFRCYAHIKKEQIMAYVEVFFQRWSTHAWKRERLANTLLLSDHSVDVRHSFRWPIFSRPLYGTGS